MATKVRIKVTHKFYNFIYRGNNMTIELRNYQVEDLLVALAAKWNEEVQIDNERESAMLEQSDLLEKQHGTLKFAEEQAQVGKKHIKWAEDKIEQLTKNESTLKLKLAAAENDRDKYKREAKENAEFRSKYKKLQKSNAELVKGREASKTTINKLREDMRNATKVIAQARISSLYGNADGENIMIMPHLMDVNIDGQGQEKMLTLLYNRNGCGVYRGVALEHGTDEVGFALPKEWFDADDNGKELIEEVIPMPSDRVKELCREWLIKVRSQGWNVYSEDLDLARYSENTMNNDFSYR